MNWKIDSISHTCSEYLCKSIPLNLTNFLEQVIHWAFLLCKEIHTHYQCDCLTCFSFSFLFLFSLLSLALSLSLSFFLSVCTCVCVHSLFLFAISLLCCAERTQIMTMIVNTGLKMTVVMGSLGDGGKVCHTHVNISVTQCSYLLSSLMYM